MHRIYILVGDVGRVASAALRVVVHEFDFQPELPDKLGEPENMMSSVMDLFTRAFAAWVAPANASGRVEYVSTGSDFGFDFAPTSAEAPPDVTSFS